MSLQPDFDNAQPVAGFAHPVVLRFAGLHPGDLGRFRMHDRRRGGDLSHVDPHVSDPHEVLLGEPDWIEVIRHEISQASRHNLQHAIAALRANSRQKMAAEVEQAGPVDPWRRGKHGPLREGVLSVNKNWFGGTGHADWDPERVALFKLTAMAFLTAHFAHGQLRYASAHSDEEAFHIHFVVLVWNERITANRGRQLLLQASANPLLSRYEHAQDLAGEAFADLGIIRGERRAEARRVAKAAGAPMPETRRHVPPSQWRHEQIERGAAEARRILAAARETAATIIEEGRTLATAMARDAEERRDQAARERAATECQRDVLDREVAQLTLDAAAARRDGALAAAELATTRKEMAAVCGALETATAGLQTAAATRADALAQMRQTEQDLFDAEAKRDRAEQEERDARDRLSGLEDRAVRLDERVLAAEDELRLILQRSGIAQENAAVARRAADQAEAAKRAAEANLAATRSQRQVEEGRLVAVQASLRAAAKERSRAMAIAAGLIEGMEFYAAGWIRWLDGASGSPPKLIWSDAAPAEKEARRKLAHRIEPALPMLTRLAGTVSGAVQAILASERRALALDAAFIAGLREDWNPEQKARIDRIAAAGNAPDYPNPT